MHVRTSLLFFCVLGRCLHKEIRQQDGTSKRLFEIHDAIPQNPLGTDAGADGAHQAPLKSPSRLIKHAVHLFLTWLGGFVSASL